MREHGGNNDKNKNNGNRCLCTGADYNNDDLAKVVDTSDEWISQRTGIRERRISAGENTSALAIGTAKQMIERAEISPEDVDLIIVASVTPDYGTPSLACMVQKELGMVNAVAFDVVAACSGFMFALSIADKYIKTGVYRNAVVIGAETLSKSSTGKTERLVYCLEMVPVVLMWKHPKRVALSQKNLAVKGNFVIY